MKPSKSILYFTDNCFDPVLAEKVRALLKDIGLPIVSVSLKPLQLGENIVLDLERGYLTMFRQILAGLEASPGEVVFMAEHDVLYPKEHFDFNPPNRQTFYYDVNWYKVHLDDKSVVRWRADQVSGLCAYRDTLIDHYRERVETFDKDNFDRKFEPGSGIESAQWEASVPHIDIRHSKNLTYNKRSLNDFRKKDTAVNFETTTIDKIPGWENLGDIL